MRKSLLFTAAVAAVVVLSGVTVYAQTWATVEGQSSGTVGVTLGNPSVGYPIITAIGSAPVGSLDGYTYSSYSVFSQDSSGSGDLYGSSASFGSYTPAVGDAVTATGTYAPYHQIPEVDALTAVSAASSGNTVPTAPVFSIPTLVASGTGPIPESIAGYVLQVQNVELYTDAACTIPVSGNFATHANTTLYAEDGSANTMEVYVWASSYSTDGAMGGTPIPTGLVDLTGFMSQSSTFPPEMTPFQITPVAVPEPATIALVGTGLLGLFLIRRRRG